MSCLGAECAQPGPRLLSRAVRQGCTILNGLPTTKRTQSGDLGELIATEYVDAQTTFYFDSLHHQSPSADKTLVGDRSSNGKP